MLKMSSQSTPNIGTIASLLPWQVRSVTDKLTNLVMNYTEAEAKVREATNEDPWGPTGPQLQEISRYTYTYETYHEAVSMLWRRMLQDREESWRRVYKSLLVLDYVVRNGSERAVTSSKEHVFELKQLVKYTFLDSSGKDQGLNVRNRAKELVELLQDDERLREERRKARRSKEKFVGMSSDEAPFYQNSAARRVSGMPSGSNMNRESSMSTTTRRDEQDDSYSDRYEWKDDSGSIAEPADYHHRETGNNTEARSKRSSDNGEESTPPRTTTPAAVSGVIPHKPQQQAPHGAFDLLGDLSESGSTLSATTNSSSAAGNTSSLMNDDFNPFQSNAGAVAASTTLFEQQQQPSAGFVPDFSSAFTLSQPTAGTNFSAQSHVTPAVSPSFANFEQQQQHQPKGNARPSSGSNVPSVLPAPPPPRSTITINRSSSSGLVGNVGLNSSQNSAASAAQTSLNDDLFNMAITTNVHPSAHHNKNNILQSFVSAPTGIPGSAVPAIPASFPFAQQQQQQQPASNEFDIFSSSVQPAPPAGASVTMTNSLFPPGNGMQSLVSTDVPLQQTRPAAPSSLLNFDFGLGGGGSPLAQPVMGKSQATNSNNTMPSLTNPAAAAAAGKTWQNLDRPVNINIDASSLVGSGLKTKSPSMYEMALKKQQQHQQVVQPSPAPQSPSASTFSTPLQPVSLGQPAAAAPASFLDDDNSLI